jgi:hypothetical protein
VILWVSEEWDRWTRLTVLVVFVVSINDYRSERGRGLRSVAQCMIVSRAVGMFRFIVTTRTIFEKTWELVPQIPNESCLKNIVTFRFLDFNYAHHVCIYWNDQGVFAMHRHELLDRTGTHIQPRTKPIGSQGRSGVSRVLDQKPPTQRKPMRTTKAKTLFRLFHHDGGFAVSTRQRTLHNYCSQLVQQGTFICLRSQTESSVERNLETKASTNCRYRL